MHLRVAIHLCLTVGLCMFSYHSFAFAFSVPAAAVDINDASLPVRMISERVWRMEAEYDFVADPNIPDLIKSLGLTTLYDLVVKAGLAPVLSDTGPYTVFGPTNDAFSKLPDWFEKGLANKTVLTNVLEYHVLPIKFPSASLKDELLVDTALKGRQLRINIYTNINATNEIMVVTTQCAPIDLTNIDKVASNGLVHVLSSVMIPPLGNIVETVVSCPVFKTLVTAVKAAGLAQTLGGKGPYTLFAPTDKAFKKLPPGTLDKLLKNATALQNVLEYHVVPLTYCSVGLGTGLYGKITTLNKQDIHIDISSGGVKVNNARVILPDGSVSNGVIHAIDRVLLPPGFDL